MHILPKVFVKVRYYGVLSNRYNKQKAIYRKPQAIIKNETTQGRVLRLTGFDVYHCSYCYIYFINSLD